MSEIISGLELPDSPRYIAPEVEPRKPIEFDVAERTALAVSTFASLGLISDRVAATEAIGRHMQDLHDTASIEATFTSAEPFMTIELTDRFRATTLAKVFDAKQEPRPNTGENKFKHFDRNKQRDFWHQYTLAELNSRRVGQKAALSVTQGSEVRGEARAMVLGGAKNRYHEDGLYYTDTYQKKLIKALESIDIMNPADYIMLQAQRREAGEEPLDVKTTTRFPQLDPKVSGGGFWLPIAEWRENQLELRGMVNAAYDCHGVRLIVGPEESTG